MSDAPMNEALPPVMARLSTHGVVTWRWLAGGEDGEDAPIEIPAGGDMPCVLGDTLWHWPLAWRGAPSEN